jgi:putative transcriptional regulator
VKRISGDEIRSLQEREHLSQAVFARYLNLSRLCLAVGARRKAAERSSACAVKRIRRKGIEAIL